MAAQLDILALEPLYGGARRAMIQTLIRCSRHRWTLLTLPARRIERRLLVAARWFGEQITRNELGPFDVLLAGEAMNLADLFRTVPHLAERPSVVYFHDNQLPDPAAPSEGALDLVNLNSAMAATEIWFNSRYHQELFLARATKVVGRHRELTSRSPIQEITKKSRHVPPPVDLTFAHAITHFEKPPREPRTILVDPRQGDVGLLIQSMRLLKIQDPDPWTLLTIGPVRDIPAGLSHQSIDERDEEGQILACHRAGIYLSVHPGLTFDELLIHCMESGAWPVVPEQGAYPELLPESLHKACLYDASPESLVSHILELAKIDRSRSTVQEAMEAVLRQFDGARASQTIDMYLEALCAKKAK